MDQALHLTINDVFRLAGCEHSHSLSAILLLHRSRGPKIIIKYYSIDAQRPLQITRRSLNQYWLFSSR